MLKFAERPDAAADEAEDTPKDSKKDARKEPRKDNRDGLKAALAPPKVTAAIFEKNSATCA